MVLLGAKGYTYVILEGLPKMSQKYLIFIDDLGKFFLLKVSSCTVVRSLTWLLA